MDKCSAFWMTFLEDVIERAAPEGVDAMNFEQPVQL
jgi:hypothetical protein